MSWLLSTPISTNIITYLPIYHRDSRNPACPLPFLPAHTHPPFFPPFLFSLLLFPLFFTLSGVLKGGVTLQAMSKKKNMSHAFMTFAEGYRSWRPRSPLHEAPGQGGFVGQKMGLQIKLEDAKEIPSLQFRDEIKRDGTKLVDRTHRDAICSSNTAPTPPKLFHPSGLPFT